MLRKGISTVAALDNIDHNPSSTTAKGSFHETGISLIQFPTKENEGTSRGIYMCLPILSSQKVSLPESFTCVPAIYLDQMPFVPDLLTSTTEFSGNLEPAKAKENCWIEHALPLLYLNKLKDHALSWAAYHASVQPNPSAIIALLPLFLEKADSPAMVKRGLDLVKGITDFLNQVKFQCLYVIARSSSYVRKSNGTFHKLTKKTNSSLCLVVYMLRKHCGLHSEKL